jgi:hypothetical protein
MGAVERRSRNVGLPWLLGLGLLSPDLDAADGVRLSLAPGNCLRQSEVAQQIRELRQSKPATDLEVYVIESEGRVAIEFFHSGRRVAQRTLQRDQATCAELSRAVALTISLGLDDLAQTEREGSTPPSLSMTDDPSAVSNAWPATEPQNGPGSAPKRVDLAEEGEAPQLPGQRPALRQAEVSAWLGGSAGVLPAPTGTLELTLGYQPFVRDAYSIAVRGGALVTSGATSQIGESGSRLHSSLAAGTLDVCWRSVWGAEVCAGSLAGSVSARGEGFEDDASGQSPWIALGLGLGWQSSPRRRFFWGARFRVVGAVLRPEFQGVDETGAPVAVDVSPPVGALFAVGGGLRF